MSRFIVNATGHPPQKVSADNWLQALGKALPALGLLDSVERLACEVLPNESVVARDIRTGMGFVVVRSDGEGTPAPAIRRGERPREAFVVENLPLSVFQANLSHELRTPLNTIIGYAGMLMEEAHDNNLPRMAHDLRNMHSAAGNLLELINAGLDAAKQNTGTQPVQRLTFEIVELMEDAAAAFQSMADRRRNTIELHPAPNLGVMRADPTHLRETLIELLRRSNQRVREGILHIDARVVNDSANVEWVELTVSDTGPPPSEDEVAGLFQVFMGTESQEGEAARSIRRGMCRSMCQKMGGDLTLVGAKDGTHGVKIRMSRGR